ncbi:MAG: hypothetical protein ACLFTR_01585 [Candidatus Woesearchaeota archaeon]
MAVKKRSKRIFIVAFLITVILMVSIFFSNSIVSEMREDKLEERMDTIINDYEEMQTLLLMADHFGEEYTCMALEKMLSGMNEELWDLGMQIDQYRQATEEFMESPFYYQKKTLFNQRSVLYYMLMKRIESTCGADQTLMSFFYREKSECPDCDPQAFVLTDIRHELEDQGRGDDLALFSFDADLDLPTLDLLLKYYNITEFPCVVIGEDRFCGLRNKAEMVELLCEETNGSLCI